MNGWVKLHRRLLDNPRSGDPEWVAVWVYLLLNATHQPYRVNFDGHIIELQPGQLVSGRLAIADATGVHESKVKRILAAMKTDQQIDQQAGVHGSIFTVRNWQTYQNCDQQNGQQVTSDRPASDQRLTTNKKDKNRRTEKQKNGECHPTEGFNKFWRVFPRKEKKADAVWAWHEYIEPNEAELLPEILTALEWQSKLDDWTKEDGRWCPTAAQYLIDERWKDIRGKPMSETERHAKF